jgi:pimeloyl-ACP methyl ester carboxylesterase
MGGFINLRLALRHADKVAGLVLVDTQAHSEDPDKRAQYEVFLKIARDDGVGEDLANVLVTLLFGTTFAEKPESDLWRKKLMTQDIEARHAMVRAVFERDDVHGRLGEIRAPAIVIHGREDVAIEAERAEELARDLPDATIELIDECGHCSPHERAAAVTPIIRSFLTRIGY